MQNLLTEEKGKLIIYLTAVNWFESIKCITLSFTMQQKVKLLAGYSEYIVYKLFGIQHYYKQYPRRCNSIFHHDIPCLQALPFQ